MQTDYAVAAAVHPEVDRHHWMGVEDYQELSLTGFAGVQNEHAEAAAVHHVEGHHHWMVVVSYQ